MFPGQCYCAGHKANPFPLGVGAHIDQYCFARLHPLAGQLRRYIPTVAGDGANRHRLRGRSPR